MKQRKHSRVSKLGKIFEAGSRPVQPELFGREIPKAVREMKRREWAKLLPEMDKKLGVKLGQAIYMRRRWLEARKSSYHAVTTMRKESYAELRQYYVTQKKIYDTGMKAYFRHKRRHP